MQHTNGISAIWKPAGEVSLASSSITPREYSTSSALIIASGDGDAGQSKPRILSMPNAFNWDEYNIVNQRVPRSKKYLQREIIDELSLTFACKNLRCFNRKWKLKIWKETLYCTYLLHRHRRINYYATWSDTGKEDMP